MNWKILLFCLWTLPIFAQNNTLSKQELEFELELLDASKFYLQEEYNKAIDGLKKCIKIKKESPVCYHLLANSYWRIGKPNEALTHAQKAHELDNTNLYYVTSLTDIYKDTDNFEKAAQTLSQYIDKYSVGWENYVRLSALYRVMGQNQKAIDVFNLAEKRLGYTEEIGRAKQKIFKEIALKKEALEETEKLIQNFPYQIEYYEIKAQQLIDDNSPQVLEFLDKSISYFPHLPQLYFKKCLWQIRQKQEQAYATAQKAFELWAVLEEQKLAFLYQAARIPQVEENFDENFAKILSLAYQQHPANKRIQDLLTDYLVKFERYEQVPQIILNYLRFDASRREDWYNLLLSEEKLKRYEQLAQHSEEALSYFPNDIQFWIFQGRAFLARKETAEAQLAFEQAQKMLNFSKNKSENALEQELRAVLGLAECFFVEGNTNKSETYLRQAQDLAKSPQAYEILGDVLFRVGKRENAVSAWQKSQDLGNKSQNLSKKIIEKNLVE